MAIYESMIVYGSRLEGSEIEEEISKFSGLIEAGDGSVHSVERMGKRRLAYEIKRNLDGYYTVFYFQTEPDRIAPLQRALRLNEAVIRHVVLRKEKFPEGPTVAVEEVATTTASPEPREAEGRPAEAEAEKPAAPAEEAPAEEAPKEQAEEPAPEAAEAPAEEAAPSEEEPEAKKAEEETPAAETEPESENEEQEKPKEGGE